MSMVDIIILVNACLLVGVHGRLHGVSSDMNTKLCAQEVLLPGHMRPVRCS